ncbi:DUF2934 domain-containing protein [Rhizobium sullae]|uniref:DUF2934 domain-containing protein n=1 Tax=Rhizobium sullae TaxID=50338 RepID=UPI000B35FAAD|nr:DUF2934 domain-containing protein [Rhizobium sullae]
MNHQNRDEWIAKRAYALWEGCGREHGRNVEHWAQATREYDELERTRASADGQEVLVRFRPKPATTISPRRAEPGSAAMRG